MKMYNPIKTIKSMYKDYDTETGATALAIVGGVVGGIAGLALPLYVGWEIGDYIKNALEFGAVTGTATKVMGSAVLTSVAGGITISLGTMGGRQ